MIEGADQIRTRDDTDDLVRVRIQNRHLPPAAGCHAFFEFGNRIIWIDADRAGGHQISSGFVELVGNRAVNISAGEQPDQLFIIHHRIAFKTIPFHQLRGVYRAYLRAEGQRILGHHLADFNAGRDNLGDGFDHPPGNLRKHGIGDIGV